MVRSIHYVPVVVVITLKGVAPCTLDLLTTPLHPLLTRKHRLSLSLKLILWKGEVKHQTPRLDSLGCLRPFHLLPLSPPLGRNVGR